MVELLVTIILIIILFVLFFVAIWRFSLLVRAFIDAYQNDKKIDKEEFIELYHQSLKYFTWLFFLFSVDIKKLMSIEGDELLGT